jgi:predicted nucleic acid-binding protein
MVLIDTKVLLDIATKDPEWFEWSSAHLEPVVNGREAAINPVIYAELAPAYQSARELDLNLVPPSDFKRLPLPYSAAFPASRAFLAYRRSGGQHLVPLPDFFIGAHAEVEGHTILTRDPRRFRAYFPQVRLICPSKGARP